MKNTETQKTLELNESSTLKPCPPVKHITSEIIANQTNKNRKQHFILVAFEGGCTDLEVGSTNTLLNKSLKKMINTNRVVTISLSRPEKTQVANNVIRTKFDLSNI